MNGDTQTQKYLNIAANGTREDLPTDTCCTTKTQKYILDVAERLFNNEEEIAEKQDKLTAGENITIDPETNVISATGGGSSVTLYNELGENTDGPITQKASREMIFGNSDRTAIRIGTVTDTRMYTGTIGIGNDVRFIDSYGIAIGYNSNSTGSNAIAIGRNATNTNSSVAIGADARNDNYSSAVAIGSSATTSHYSSVALGAYSQTGRSGEVNVGTGTRNYGYDNTNTRVIGGVHAGVADTDAVNVAQLNTAVGDIETALTTLNSGTGV